MTLQDLLLDEEIDRVRRLDLAWAEFEHEARQHQPPNAVRRALGGAFVRFGHWLDRTADKRTVGIDTPAATAR